MTAEQTVVFIHGLGDTPEAWAHQIGALPPGFRGVAVGVPGLMAGDGFDLAEAAQGIVSALDDLGIAAAHLCGLSLGAMIAFRIAVDHPDRVLSLVLAAGQVKPPRVLMAVQRRVLGLLPEKLVASEGVNRARMLAVLDAVARTDLSHELQAIVAPTLVLCGSRDRANLRAARDFATGIRDAELRVIPGAGHQMNVTAAEAFSVELNRFLARG